MNITLLTYILLYTFKLYINLKMSADILINKKIFQICRLELPKL